MVKVDGPNARVESSWEKEKAIEVPISNPPNDCCSRRACTSRAFPGFQSVPALKSCPPSALLRPPGDPPRERTSAGQSLASSGEVEE